MCNCINETNKSLREAGYNTRITVPMVLTNSLDFEASMTLVVTEKWDKSDREQPIKLYASYCPFCGKEYKTEEKANR